MGGKLGLTQWIALAVVVAGGLTAVLVWTGTSQKEVPIVASEPIVIEEGGDTSVEEVTEEADTSSGEETSSVSESAEAVEEQESAEEAEASEPTVETPKVEPEIAVAAPGFDVVRVENDGTAIVAGTCPAGWNVSIMVDNEELTQVLCDETGQFVAFVDFGASETARVVSLEAHDGSEVLVSEAQVIIAPVLTRVAEATEAPKAAEVVEEEAQADPTLAESEVVAEETETVEPAAEVAEVTEVATEAEATSGDVEVSEATEEETSVADATPIVSSTSPETELSEVTPEAEAKPVVEEETVAVEESDKAADEDGVAEAEPETPEISEAPEVAVTEEAEEKSPAVLLVGNNGVEVLQPAESAPNALAELAIDAISYTDTGDVQLSGRSPAGFIRVYLNNVALMTLEVPEPGNWTANLSDVAPGVYTLRVDQVDESGNVVARIETPFQREEPEKVQAIAQEVEETLRPLVSVEVVQPGATLWAISRRQYGAGILYVNIFEANRDQIRDPDLIYPGQIFDLPAPPGAKKKTSATGQ